MALSQADKILVAEYVAAGWLAREVADRLLSGRITKVENSLFKSFVRMAGRAVGRTALTAAGTAGMVARRHPVITAGALAYIAHTQGVSLDTARAIAEQEVETFRMQPHFFIEDQLKERIRGLDIPPLLPIMREAAAGERERMGPPGYAVIKRKVSKANRAVKQAMTWLKTGTKAATGAAVGTLPGGAFRTAVKAAGMANPKTKSKPGKGKSIMNKLARRLKKWW